MIEIKAPEAFKGVLERNREKTSVFLAGSIEEGTAKNWQKEMSEELKDLDIVLLNPRRLAWDKTWIQDISNQNFKEQVEWELEAISLANRILMYFDPKTKSPITLLELGLSVSRGKDMWVICPEGFWRRGNVQIICQKYKIPLFNNIYEVIELFKKEFNFD